MKQNEHKLPELNPLGNIGLAELGDFDPAEEKDSSWLISFVDILCLLITLFVVLLSFSSATRHDTTRSIPLTTARPTLTPQPVAASKMPAQALAAPQDVPVLAIPQNIENMVEVAASATEINLVIKDDVLFAEGSADLTALGRSVLDGIAQILKQNSYPISVEGHTDNVPIHTAQFPSNWELSSFRATNVARYFIRSGVATERLRAIGYADTRPVAANDNEAGRARNRRVSLVIQVKQAPRAPSFAALTPPQPPP